MSEIQETIMCLKKAISEILETITCNEKKKKTEIIIYSLLVPLSCLVKHSRFEIEKELRMFSVQKLKKENNLVKYCNYSRRMYIETSLPNLKTVTFGAKTKASDIRLFEDRLAMTSLKAVCIKSEHDIE
jgi:hypothetical protein